MNRLISYIIVAALLAICTVSYAAPDKVKTSPVMAPSNKAKMEKHVEKAKRKNPEKYNFMMERANNMVVDCLGCHSDLLGPDNN